MQAIDARISTIKGSDNDLPKETVKANRKVADIMGSAADELKKVYANHDHDVGRAINTMDLLQQAKDTAIQSLAIPHHKK